MVYLNKLHMSDDVVNTIGAPLISLYIILYHHFSVLPPFQGPRSASFCFGMSSKVTEALFAHLEEKQEINTLQPMTNGSWYRNTPASSPRNWSGVTMKHLPKKPLPFEFLAQCALLG